jgi:hypothetical protein
MFVKGTVTVGIRFAHGRLHSREWYIIIGKFGLCYFGAMAVMNQQSFGFAQRAGSRSCTKLQILQAVNRM